MQTREVELNNVYLGLPQKLRITENAIYILNSKFIINIPFFPETFVVLNKNNSLTIQNRKLIKYNFLFNGNNLLDISGSINSTLKWHQIFKERLISSLIKGSEAIYLDAKEQKRNVFLKFYILSNHFEILDILCNKPIIKQTVSNISSLLFKIKNNIDKIDNIDKINKIGKIDKIGKIEFHINLKSKDKCYVLIFEDFEASKMIFMSLLYLCLGSANKYFYSSHYSKIALQFTRLFSLFKSYLLKNKGDNPFKNIFKSFASSIIEEKKDLKSSIASISSISPQIKININKCSTNLDVKNGISTNKDKINQLLQIDNTENLLMEENQNHKDRYNQKLKLIELQNESFANNINENENIKTKEIEIPRDSLVNYECFLSTELIRKSENYESEHSEHSEHSENTNKLLENKNKIPNLDNDFDTSFAKKENETSKIKKNNFINKNLKHMKKSREDDKSKLAEEEKKEKDNFDKADNSDKTDKADNFDKTGGVDKTECSHEKKIIKATLNEVTKVLISKNSNFINYINFLQEEIIQMKNKIVKQKGKIHSLKSIVKENKNQKQKFDETLNVYINSGNKK